MPTIRRDGHFMILHAFWGLLLLGLVACGGSSSDGSSEPPPSPPADSEPEEDETDDQDENDSPSDNQSPMVSAGADQSLYEADSVTLNAEASDSDGEIAAYQWSQTDGDSVSYQGDSTDTLTFTAPMVGQQPIELVFEVVVTDDQGATASDQVRVTVAPEEAPELSLYFPTPEALLDAEAETIAVFGRVQPRGEVDVDRVVVNAGNGESTATLDQGRWRVNDLALPDGDGEVSIEVTATNVEGHASRAESTLYRDRIELGEGPTWALSPGLDLGPNGETLYLLTYDGSEAPIKLMPVDLATGDRGRLITDFFDETLGPDVKAFLDMVHDPDNERFLLAVAPQDGDKQIVAVDQNTGERTVVSGPDTGTGPAFVRPSDLFLDGEGRLWVTDNEGDGGAGTGVVRVDLANGDRERVAEKMNLMSGLLDADRNRFLATDLASGNSTVTAFDLSTEPPVASEFSTGEPALPLGVDSMHLDPDNNRVLLRARGSDELIAIDLDSGERTRLASDVLGLELDQGETNDTETAYDADKQVFYAAGGASRDAVVAVDPETGDRILISR